MSRDSTLILDDRYEDKLKYLDKTSGEIRWLVIKHQNNYRNTGRSKYLVYDNNGDVVHVTDSRWRVGVFIAEQEGTYANHGKMLEFVGASTVKVTAPWATDDEKRQMVNGYLEKALGQEVPFRKSKTDPPSVYYKVHRSVVTLKEAHF